MTNNKILKCRRKKDRMSSNWRPMMGWTYMITCWFDFILGPLFYNLMQFHHESQIIDMWSPLTLQGGGVYHIAMGAIVGVSAWSRGREKIAGAETIQTYENPGE